VRSGGRMMSCVIYTVHLETRSTSLLDELQNQGRVSWLSLKMKFDVFLIWASKPVALVWWFGLQNNCVSLLVWASKPSRLRFVSCATKPTGGWFDAGHASRSGGLLRLEASQARVFQSGLKTGEGATTSDTRGIIAEVVSSESRRRMGRCDELHQTLVPQLCYFLCIRP
jgi:hypothetical protein